MSDFTDDYIFYVLFIGLYQALFAVVVAGTVIPFLSHFAQRSYGSLVRHFALLNGFLLAWGGLGESLWLHLTANRLSVAADCPVWAPFVPFGRWVLDSAGGWQLLGGTTIGQLQLLWAVIAFLVWVISFLSVSAFRSLFAQFVHRTRATTVTNHALQPTAGASGVPAELGALQRPTGG